MEIVASAGAFAFGLVLGWLTYLLVRKEEKHSLTDLGTIIGALGGAAVLALFPQGTFLFGFYAIGLAVGFFAYFIAFLKIVGPTAIKESVISNQPGPVLGNEKPR